MQGLHISKKQWSFNSHFHLILIFEKKNLFTSKSECIHSNSSTPRNKFINILVHVNGLCYVSMYIHTILPNHSIFFVPHWPANSSSSVSMMKMIGWMDLIHTQGRNCRSERIDDGQNGGWRKYRFDIQIHSKGIVSSYWKYLLMIYTNLSTFQVYFAFATVWQTCPFSFKIWVPLSYW